MNSEMFFVGSIFNDFETVLCLIVAFQKFEGTTFLSCSPSTCLLPFIIS